MIVTDVIREADTEHVIYFLLSSYVGVARDCDRLRNLPEQIAALPVTGKDDVKSRFKTLLFELDAASKRLDDQACTSIKEALTIYGTALSRLERLDGSQSRSANAHSPARDN
jgi:hypothetical protein